MKGGEESERGEEEYRSRLQDIWRLARTGAGMPVSLCGLSLSVCGEEYLRFPTSLPFLPLSTPSQYAFLLSEINDKHASQLCLSSLSLSGFPHHLHCYIYLCAAAREIWTMEPDAAATVIIMITIITWRSEPGPKNKILHLCLHKSSRAEDIKNGNSSRSVLGVSPVPLWRRGEEERAGWSSVGGGLEKRGRRNCCFHKERSKQAALGMLSHQNPRGESFS